MSCLFNSIFELLQEHLPKHTKNLLIDHLRTEAPLPSVNLKKQMYVNLIESSLKQTEEET